MYRFRSLLISLSLIHFSACHYEDYSNGYYYHKAYPQDVIVDVINNFGVSLLESHNDGNNNNIALSPYGATSVLIALGEGVRGFAVQELQEVMRLPQDASVIRVGLRDIHRHLKSYFIPKEGFLAGLTLNNEKVELNDEYKEILRFYGFDLDSFNSPLYPEVFDTTTITMLNSTDEISTTTPQSIETTETTEITTVSSTTEQITTTSTTTQIITTSEEIVSKSTKRSVETTTELPETTTTNPTTPTTTNPITTTTTNPTTTTTTNPTTTTTIPTTVKESLTTTQTSEDVTEMETVEDDQTTNDLDATSTETISTEDESSTEMIRTTTEEEEDIEESKKKRNSRSIVDYIIARHFDNQLFKTSKNNYQPEEHPTFLIYGTIREPNINFMTYDAVLPITFLPLLNAMALSFPLDSKEYYLLLILPLEDNGIDKLIHNLAHTTSLRDVITSLRYDHVRAVIPSFMLKGYVVLTSSLQKLGIQRIFEPRRTDFSLMTKEKDVYVTNIEQAVTVTIRNYVNEDNLPNYRNLQRSRPLLFQADHPFLYFVMDTEIHVALMAGKIVNPLNSRIK